jgi:phosphoribosylcarboxyaminoimidazole (NCAIR) mutase
MQFVHDEETMGRTQTVCTHKDMIRGRDEVDAHIARYISSLDKSHINVTIAGGGNATHVLGAYIGG